MKEAFRKEMAFRSQPEKRAMERGRAFQEDGKKPQTSIKVISVV